MSLRFTGALCFVLAMMATACGSVPKAASAEATTPIVAASDVEPAPTTASTTTSTTSSTTIPPPTLLECVEKIPLEIRLGQLLFPVVTQGEFDEVARLATDGLIAGVVVLGSPTASIAEDIAAVQEASLIGPSIMAVDEEGGRVQRLSSLVGRMPSARTMATTMTGPEVRVRTAEHARAIGALGFTMNLAPVIDLDTGDFIRDRSFSSDPAVVSTYGVAVARGIADGGLTPVAKHFPGHGRGVDSHLGLPSIPGVGELRTSDLIPFETMIRLGDTPIMVGHLVVPDLTDGLPATLSSAAINGLLRNELGFDGLVMTDAFNMDAISRTHNNAEAAELAIIAGVDLVMLGRLNAVEPTIGALTEAVNEGRLDEATVNESVVRVLETKGVEPCSVPGDERAAIACLGVSGGGCANA
ncbi:MAG: glycoside hydrolase family 3 protein [Acidimicrobiales bacterium]|nr:MAG: glycoside hydrolase family 3 protein [Acidimicrobiales bacterium]